MYSRYSRFRPQALGLALALALASGCGHKDDPKPPPSKIPARVADLQVAQRGTALNLEFTYPQTTISGLPIDDIVAVELWEHAMAVPDFRLEALADEDQEAESEGDVGEPTDDPEADSEGAAEAPEEPAPAQAEVDDMPDAADQTESEDDVREPDEGEADQGEEQPDAPTTAVSKEALLEVDPFEFVAASRLRLRLEGQELANAIRGDKLELRLTLDLIEPGEKQALVYAVKTFQTLNRASGFSNLVKIVPRETPDPPSDLELEAVPNGVKISWTFEGDDPEEFRFYRRDPLAAGFDRHFGFKAGDSDQFLDATAELDRTYLYAMSVVINRAPVVESVLSEEREITYRDVFPPAPPTDLVVLTEVATARLLWEASSDRDVAGYVIFRRAGAADFIRLNERPVRAAEYIDTTVSSGRTYAYRVVAADREGNLSDPSEEVEVRIP